MNSFFVLKKFYFNEKVFKLQIWPFDKKLRLRDVHKFDKIGQPLKIFLYNGTIQASKNFSMYLYDFTEHEKLWILV